MARQSFLTSLGKGFVRSAVNQIGREGGKVISNRVYNNQNYTNINSVNNMTQYNHVTDIPVGTSVMYPLRMLTGSTLFWLIVLAVCVPFGILGVLLYGYNFSRRNKTKVISNDNGMVYVHEEDAPEAYIQYYKETGKRIMKWSGIPIIIMLLFMLIGLFLPKPVEDNVTKNTIPDGYYRMEYNEGGLAGAYNNHNEKGYEYIIIQGDSVYMFQDYYTKDDLNHTETYIKSEEYNGGYYEMIDSVSFNTYMYGLTRDDVTKEPMKNCVYVYNNDTIRVKEKDEFLDSFIYVKVDTVFDFHQKTIKETKLENKTTSTKKKSYYSFYCQAITHNGTQCSRRAKYGNYCWQHQ